MSGFPHIGTFGAYSHEPLDLCADCAETTYRNASVLPPELIMVLVSPLREF